MEISPAKSLLFWNMRETYIPLNVIYVRFDSHCPIWVFKIKSMLVIKVEEIYEKNREKLEKAYLGKDSSD